MWQSLISCTVGYRDTIVKAERFLERLDMFDTAVWVFSNADYNNALKRKKRFGFLSYVSIVGCIIDLTLTFTGYLTRFLLIEKHLLT